MTNRDIIVPLLWFAICLTAIVILALHNNDGWAFLVFIVMLSLRARDKGESK